MGRLVAFKMSTSPSGLVDARKDSAGFEAQPPERQRRASGAGGARVAGARAGGPRRARGGGRGVGRRPAHRVLAAGTAWVTWLVEK